MTNASKQEAAQPQKLRTLVVGGAASFVRSTLTKKLAWWGLEVVEHRDGRDAAAVGTGKYDAVVILFREVPRRDQTEAWTAAAQGAKLPYVLLDRQESRWQREMETKGFFRQQAAPESLQLVPAEPSSGTQDGPRAEAESDTLDGVMTQMLVLLSEAEDLGLEKLLWEKGHGLEYEATVRVKRRRMA